MFEILLTISKTAYIITTSSLFIISYLTINKLIEQPFKYDNKTLNFCLYPVILLIVFYSLIYKADFYSGFSTPILINAILPMVFCYIVTQFTLVNIKPIKLSKPYNEEYSIENFHLALRSQKDMLSFLKAQNVKDRIKLVEIHGQTIHYYYPKILKNPLFKIKSNNINVID